MSIDNFGDEDFMETKLVLLQKLVDKELALAGGHGTVLYELPTSCLQDMIKEPFFPTIYKIQLIQNLRQSSIMYKKKTIYSNVPNKDPQAIFFTFPGRQYFFTCAIFQKNVENGCVSPEIQMGA
uniref:Uncharacterized protein n=1 Tax=Romanomermis culicivorax TaxID=13658 RepID=A0A915HMR7_ROMCU